MGENGRTEGLLHEKTQVFFFEKLETFEIYDEWWVVEGWKTILDACVCDLVWIGDDFKVWAFMDALSYFIFRIIR